MKTVFVDDPAPAAYRFPGGHPLRPERFTLTAALVRAWGLVTDDESSDAAHHLVPDPAAEEDLLLAHDPDYMEAVMRADAGLLAGDAARYGIGPGDTPAFPGMHRAASLCVGGTIAALEAVLSGSCDRAHNPAGGLHHAHRDHASGFCIYNDVAVAVRRAQRSRPGFRIAYVDIDAHHGDGVEAAFADDPEVLTVSVHESGSYLFPGSGRTTDVGTGAGEGTAVNVPLLPYSGEESYRLAVREAVRPALVRFQPDVLVLQTGADSHRDDPLTHLWQSVRSFDAVVADIVAIADDVCGGRVVAVGGGGYDTFSAVPRMWGCVLARLLGVEPPEGLPAEWLSEARSAAAAAGIEWHAVAGTFDERTPDQPEASTTELARETQATIDRLRRSHPLLAGSPG